MAIPESVLVAFFEAAEKQLSEMTIDAELQSSTAIPSVAEIRRLLLACQLECMNNVVGRHNKGITSVDRQLSLDQMQQYLTRLGSGESSPPDVRSGMDRMNEAARLAFARLVLHAECTYDSISAVSPQPRSLQGSGSCMTRLDIIEFIGLCNVAVRLPNVRWHLCRGIPLFPDLQGTDPVPFYPQERLEKIQRRFLRAVGYEPDHGATEIKRIFCGCSKNVAEDELRRLFASMEATMNAAIQNAMLQAMQSGLSDHEEGGSTRIVNVEYSEHIVDAASGQVIASSSGNGAHDHKQQAPLSQQILEHRQDSSSAEEARQWELTRQTSKLHQEILGELLSMDPDERDETLQEAKSASELILKEMEELRPGVDRVNFLQEIPLSTQRLLIMEKIWESLLAENGGRSPTINSHRRPGDISERVDL